MREKIKLVVAITGASGAIYPHLLLKKLYLLEEQTEEIGVVMSENANLVWEHELQNKTYNQIPFPVYNKKDFMAPFASGSAGFNTMIVCPCSMGTLGRIAAGLSDDLITRAADVMLKERKKLILVPREAPYSQIHLKNMLELTKAGAIICPASPSFYQGAKTIEDIAFTIVDRLLLLSGFKYEHFQWGKENNLLLKKED